jgi:hypothetical protein
MANDEMIMADADSDSKHYRGDFLLIFGGLSRRKYGRRDSAKAPGLLLTDPCAMSVKLF